MQVNKNDVVDFYKQLSLLLDSHLPIPETLRQMGENFKRSEFSKILFSLAEKTEAGTPLSEAMRSFPDIFPPYQIKMIESGEKNGTLPQTLSEMAYLAHIDSQLVSMVKAMSAYPLIVIYVSFGLFFFLYTFIVPNFKKIFIDFLEGVRLPSFTELTINISDFFVNHFHSILAIYIFGFFFLLWLFLSRSILASKLFMHVIRILPLSSKIFKNLSMARLCSMWSVFVREKMPAATAFESLSYLFDDAKFSQALKNISRKISEGKNLSDALGAENLISGLLVVLVRHCPENELADELANLAVIYRDRAAGMTRRAEITWEIILILTMAVIAMLTVFSLFMPLIKIIEIIA